MVLAVSFGGAPWGPHGQSPRRSLSGSLRLRSFGEANTSMTEKKGDWTNTYWDYVVTLTWLVVYLPLWKMMEFVSWDNYSQYMENKKCSKPPTSCQLMIVNCLSMMTISWHWWLSMVMLIMMVLMVDLGLCVCHRPIHENSYIPT